EIAEMPVALQAKLLRVLQEREVDRVGGRAPVPVDVRVIATTNRDLEAQVRAGAFRADLYYRLSTFPIALPPLRARREDLPALARHLLARAAEELGRPAPALAPDALQALARHPFPGNVRELGNVLSRALIRARGPSLSASDLSLAPAPPAGAFGDAGLPLDLAALERMAITEALRRTGGNRTHAARLLGIGLRTLRAKLNDREGRGHLRLVESA
ncbi:MAG TPA: sigma 54-interacting transcriptional regulator, partial [Myxococcales bacterium]|nr:sigma 54-interacting transcriptional regulator [Myxococcales bacterium]